MSNQKTKTFTITANEEVMEKIEGFLAMLHWNSRWGHSALFGMHLDGDGTDQVTVDPHPGREITATLQCFQGHGVECAGTQGRFYSVALKR